MVLALLLVPGWLLLAPFFLMGGATAAIVAAILAQRSRNALLLAKRVSDLA